MLQGNRLRGSVVWAFIVPERVMEWWSVQDVSAVLSEKTNFPSLCIVQFFLHRCLSSAVGKFAVENSAERLPLFCCFEHSLPLSLSIMLL